MSPFDIEINEEEMEKNRQFMADLKDPTKQKIRYTMSNGAEVDETKQKLFVLSINGIQIGCFDVKSSAELKSYARQKYGEGAKISTKRLDGDVQWRRDLKEELKRRGGK